MVSLFVLQAENSNSGHSSTEPQGKPYRYGSSVNKCYEHAMSLNMSSAAQSLLSDENLFLALKLNSANFPGRNSGLPRRSTGVPSPPSCKLQGSIYLANISLSAAFLVLLAGDVSSNPGPVNYPCGICSKGCRSNQKAVQCDGCDKWHHTKCMNMGSDEYQSLAINESSSWMCFSCLFPGTECMNDSNCGPNHQLPDNLNMPGVPNGAAPQIIRSSG